MSTKRISIRIGILMLVTVFIGLFYHFTPYTANPVTEYRLKREIISPPFLQSPSHWVDSVLSSLSMNERIGQMIMIPAYSNNNNQNEKEVKKLIRNHNVGGLIFFQGSPVHQAELTNEYQSLARTPLHIAMDAEWGLGMRLDSTISYPRQMMLGAVRDEQLIYEMGAQIAEQLSRMGVHINFAPVADVNNNSENPVINSRSFGEDRANVTSKALLYMQGMQDKGVMAVAKHFPGHGDTDVDSHTELPVIRHSLQRLDSLELFPFKEMIHSGISGIMTAHMHIPELDSTENIPSSLSGIVTDSLLRQVIRFKGLVFTDAMTMSGITSYYTPEEAVKKAVLAGNDILVMPPDVPLAIRTISRMIRNDLISEEEINERCRRILMAKYWMGLNHCEPVDMNYLSRDLNRESYRLLNRRLIEASLTVVTNKNNTLPFRKLSDLKIVSVVFGESADNSFQRALNLYMPVKQYSFGEVRKGNTESLSDIIKDCDIAIVSLHSNDIRAVTNYGISDDLIKVIDSLAMTNKLVLNLFANPYVLNRFKDLSRFLAVIVSYENSSEVQDLTAQMMFGASDAHGMLPVSAGQWKSILSGLRVNGIQRLKYSLPLEANMNEDTLNTIDDTIAAAIAAQAMPGCQIMVIRNGIVVMNKAYGNHEYKGGRAVNKNDLYDLASITKVGATVPVMMKLYDGNLLDIEQKLSAYLPYLKKTDKKNIVIQDILMHQAGLPAWIPFYHALLEPVFSTQVLFNDSINDMNALRIGARQYINRYTHITNSNMSDTQSDQYPLKVAENMFIGENWTDSIYRSIAGLPLNGKNEYLYSDLGFYLFRMMIDSLTGVSLDRYADTAFYRNLGAARLCFNPLDHYAKKVIIPTEDDQYFRKQMVWGYVHDPGAAMMGGVSGHAGLFSNANDLAKLFQMYLNGGEYAGEQYIRKETLDLFTTGFMGVENNRRALGFDKPEPDTSKSGPTCLDASPLSYGHSGFTGTLVWNDPEYNLIYIFLSNRVNPDATNNKLVEMNIRTNVQQVVYNAILDKQGPVAGESVFY